MERQKSELEGKTIYGFGDSLIKGHVNGIGMLDYVAEKNGMILQKYAVNGATVITGLLKKIGKPLWFEPNIAEQILEAPSDVPDYICFDGLTNDAEDMVVKEYLGVLTDHYRGGYDRTTFIGSFEHICFLLREKYQNSAIFYVCAHKMPTRSLWAQDTFQEWARKTCEKWSIPCIDVYRAGGINTFLPGMRREFSYDDMHSTTDGDGTHLNEAGYRLWYAPMIEQALLWR